MASNAHTSNTGSSSTDSSPTVTYYLPLYADAEQTQMVDKIKLEMPAFSSGDTRAWLAWLAELWNLVNLKGWAAGPILHTQLLVLLKGTAKSNYQTLMRQGQITVDNSSFKEALRLMGTEHYVPTRYLEDLKNVSALLRRLVI